jgi:hypothetical protein
MAPRSVRDAKNHCQPPLGLLNTHPHELAEKLGQRYS